MTQQLPNHPTYRRYPNSQAQAAWKRVAAAALARARADALEEALAAIALWQSPSHVRLHAGEMTAQEMRSVQAVLGGIASRIRALKNKEPQP